MAAAAAAGAKTAAQMPLTPALPKPGLAEKPTSRTADSSKKKMIQELGSPEEEMSILQDFLKSQAAEIAASEGSARSAAAGGAPLSSRSLRVPKVPEGAPESGAPAEADGSAIGLVGAERYDRLHHIGELLS
mmetsp:Transcript_34624/g.92102  ORF Transcript_34624/g.92102 Transcript_34624/m.92102 type:complete len:132 (+) Transcript_34624:2-397(+)